MLHVSCHLSALAQGREDAPDFPTQLLLSALLAAASTTVLVRDDFSTTVLFCESRAVRGVDEQGSCAVGGRVERWTACFNSCGLMSKSCLQFCMQPNKKAPVCPGFRVVHCSGWSVPCVSIQLTLSQSVAPAPAPNDEIGHSSSKVCVTSPTELR